MGENISASALRREVKVEVNTGIEWLKLFLEFRGPFVGDQSDSTAANHYRGGVALHGAAPEPRRATSPDLIRLLTPVVCHASGSDDDSCG